MTLSRGYIFYDGAYDFIANPSFGRYPCHLTHIIILIIIGLSPVGLRLSILPGQPDISWLTSVHEGHVNNNNGETFMFLGEQTVLHKM